jgi:hypothetical protein
MTDWISVKDRLPNLKEIVWIYWRDQEVLLGCKAYETNEPQHGWYSFGHMKARYTRWWMYHEDCPFAPPNPPTEKSNDRQT